MIASVVDSNKNYQISVIGDINKDGLFNQIDVTLLIKYIVGLKDYTNLDDLSLKSADVKYDEKVNQIDLTYSIAYIVFGKLQNDFPSNEEENIEININNFKAVEVTLNSIKVQLEVDDKTKLNEEKPYKYFISENENFENSEIIENENEEILFDNLKQGTMYYIKVIVKDRTGNTTESGTLKVETKEIPTVNDNTGTGSKILEVTNPEWQNEKASIRIINRSEYITQYKILNETGEISQDWIATKEKTAEVNNLYHNYTVLVRLSDSESINERK